MSINAVTSAADLQNRLITKRASKLGFAEWEMEDLQVDIAARLLNFRYQPDKANGASFTTALISVIDGRLKTLRRSKNRYQRRFEPMQEEMDVSRDGEDGTSPVQDVERGLLADDVRRVIELLLEREQFICNALASDDSLSAIAVKLGCRWSTLQDSLTRIRDHFAAHQLDGWLVR